MVDREEQEARADLVSRLFALITMKLEDAAGIATEGQGRHPITELQPMTQQLETLLAETSTITAGLVAVLADADDA